jgi:branched-chain amino acid transport system substrate-binding protein
MRPLSKFLSMSLLAICICSPAFADGARSMKIGVLNDMSGPYSDNAGEGSVTAAKMAAEDFMQQHPEFKVEIISADHQNKADVGAAIARRWIDQEHVDAIADVPNSAVSLAINEVVRGTKAQHDTVDVRHLGCFPHHRGLSRPSWRQEVVLHRDRQCARQIHGS